MATVDLLLERRRVRQRLPRRVGRPRDASGPRLRYFRLLRGVIGQVRAVAMEELGPHLDRLQAEQRDDGTRADESPAVGIFNALLRLGARIEDIERAFDDGQLETVANQVDGLSRADVRRMISIDVGAAATGVPIDRFMAENRRLIKSLTREAGEQVESAIREGLRTGVRVEKLRDDIAERFAVTESRAELIARTETAKLKAQVDSARVQRVGITHYFWRTVGDVRVREEHAALDGQRFAYDSPPEASNGERHNPGEFPNCRCYAEPDTSEVMGDVEADEGAQAAR